MTDLSVPDAEIRASLARVTASEPFRNAPQLVAFLSYVVERTLAGAARDIKGYTIATNALGRPEDFDPQTDPIVRVEAGRLRRALDAYYGGEGHADPLRIVIPRGSYVPQFERANRQKIAAFEADFASTRTSSAVVADPAPVVASPRQAIQRNLQGESRPWLPIVAVFALAVLLVLLVPNVVSGWMNGAMRAAHLLAGPEVPPGPTIVVTPVETMASTPVSFSPDGLRKMVVDALEHFDDLTVIDAARDPVRSGDHYILSLRVTAAGTIVARLDAEPSGRSVWVRSFDPAKRQNEQDTVFQSDAVFQDKESPVEARLANEIAATLGQPYGVLFADARSQPSLDPRTRCILKSYDYWTNPSAAEHQEVRGCLEQLVAGRPHDSIVLAKLSFMYLEEYRAGYNPRPNALERAWEAARRGIEIAPESPVTNQALMAVLFASGDTGRGLALAERLLELNPYDPDMLADVGARFIGIGRHERGVELIRRAAALNPGCPPWYDFFLFLAAYMQDDFERAGRAAARISANDYALGFVAKAITAAHDGNDERARAAIERLIAIQPEFERNPAAVLARRNFSPDILERLVDGLGRAGLRP